MDVRGASKPRSASGPLGGVHSHGSWQEVGEPALPRPHPVRHDRIHPERDEDRVP